MDNQLIAVVTALFVGAALGVFGAYISRRFSDVDGFCALVLREIDAASEQSDNIGGTHCFSIWHEPSKVRIRTYMKLIDWSARTNGQRVIDACEGYCGIETGVGTYRTDAIGGLVTIYRKAKETI